MSSLPKNKMVLVVCLIILVSFSYLWIRHRSSHGKNLPDSDTSVVSYTSTSSDNEKNLGDFYLTIPSLRIESPILDDVNPADKNSYDEALKHGVAHMTGTAYPGSGKGNIFIYGHSSAVEKSEYDKVFADLNNLNPGDVINIYYQGNNFTYTVSDKRIVAKDDFSVLDQSGNETLSLMTCWPVGTDDQRLIITAYIK